MVVPDEEEEDLCYKAFLDVTSNNVLTLKTCPVCAGEKMKKEGDETFPLSDSSVIKLLTCPLEGRANKREVVVLGHLLEVNERGLSCWMCFDCLKGLQQDVLCQGMSLGTLYWCVNLDLLSIPSLPSPHV